MRYMLRSLILLFFIILQTGCGFTLRGSAELPAAMKTLYLESLDINSEIVRDMRRALLNNDVTLIDAPVANTYAIGLGREQVTERVISVNSNARAGEYELRMTLPFQLRLAAEIIIPPETLSIERVYLADPNNAVAKTEESELIRTEMRQELVMQVLRRLQTLDL